MFGDSFGTTQSGGFVVYVNGALVPLGEDGLWKWGVSSVQCNIVLYTMALYTVVQLPGASAGAAPAVCPLTRAQDHMKSTI